MPLHTVDERFGDVKDTACRRCSCLCFDDSCARCSDPCFLISGKVLCLKLAIFTACPPCTCETAGCWTEEHGCVEVQHKCCCCYHEVQCPPGCDIGVACCGVVCCGGSSEQARDLRAPI